MKLSSGKPVVLITGVSSGIGRAIAIRLAASGYRVYGTARAPKPEIEIQEVTLLRMDVLDSQSVAGAIEVIVEREGRIDVLINNAGLSASGSIEETSVKYGSRLFDTNFFGLARVTEAVLPHMRRQRSGRIVNISSILGVVPGPFMGYYCASKHAVEGYTESLDHELRPLGVRALVVQPGFTKTQISNHSLDPQTLIDDYESARFAANGAIQAQLEGGVNADDVAKIVARAVRDRSPRHRYAVGSRVALLSFLRRFLPASSFDSGLRRQFRLPGAKEAV